MKATGNFENARNVDPMVVLSGDTRAHIDHWLAKFPPDRKRSAVLRRRRTGANGGWLSDELIAQSPISDCRGGPTRGPRSFRVETEPVGRKNAPSHQFSCWINGEEELGTARRKKMG